MIHSESIAEQYLTQIANDVTTIHADVTAEKGGAGQSFGPHEMLCASLAACMNITLRMVLEHKGIAFDKVIVDVELDRQDDQTTFVTHIDIQGDIPEETKQQIIAIADRCPVRKTLSKPISFTHH